jgi:phosphoglycolate phosphatase
MTARIVFDLDGTLIDSAPDLRGIANALLAEEGRPPVSLAEVHGFIGHGAPTFVARLCAARALPPERQAPLLAAFKARYLTAHALTTVYPGVAAALQRLQEAGHRLGICTNKPLAATRAVLAHCGLEAPFTAVIGGDSLPVHKPDPAPLEAAFAALGSGPRLYVGDSEVDAATAAAAGVPFVLFTEGYRHSPAAALRPARAFSDWAAMPGHLADLLAAARA